MNAKKKYKDTVYRMLFKEPEKALSLYNSLNGTAYTDASLLEFNTLENAIYMGMKNDLSFLIMNQMYLCEQQSTDTPNMPLRGLLYVADLLQAFAKNKTLYSSRQIKIPTPHFIVFYNGTDKLPERMERKLSDAFAVPTDNSELELKVQILNINPGMNEELKEKCPALREYVIYVEKVRNYAKTMPLEEAVECAIEECIKQDVLRDFLLQQKAEVVKVSIYEYDEEREMKLIRADERAMGEELGRVEGRAEGIRAFVLDNIEEKIPVERICEKLQRRFGVSQEEAKEIYRKVSEETTH